MNLDKAGKLNLTSRKTGKFWHSPYNVFWYIDRLTKKVGPETIEKHGKLKPVREARIVAITALAIYRLTGKPAYIQLCKFDPPDAYIMQKSKEVKGQLDISTVEVTSYRRGARETFLKQLKRTKVPTTHHKYSENYILVVDLLTKNQIDFGEVNKYLNDRLTPFPVWVFRAISLFPDTIGEVTILNPRIRQLRINFGEAAFRLKSLGLPDIYSTREVESEDLVREDEPAGTYNKPPWDVDIGEI